MHLKGISIGNMKIKRRPSENIASAMWKFVLIQMKVWILISG